MKIKKINLPDEIVIEIEDAKFVFDRPSNLDQFDYPDVFSNKPEDMSELKYFGFRVKYVLAKLKRIIGLKFDEEDGKDIGKVYFKDLDVSTQINITSSYISKVKEYFDSGTEVKKDQELSESAGSSEPV